MIDMNAKPLPSEGYCVRELGEETIFLAESGDTIHSLDEVGTFIWQQIDAGATLGEIVERICNAYEVEREIVEHDLQQFAQELLDKGLINLSDG